ncbi:MAG: PEFG-CTERM sorting domain-containing protein [Nitrosopumilus sp.]|nr:PEFG-CTERM sorting domain-containing protein [Nitrosopumilus sp.]MDH3386165.1 PEFG-CTERM sorting domain-containing protein [Nitrosopumilus sp.]
MLKISILILFAIFFIPLSSAFAAGSIELSSDREVIQSTDSILVYGTVTGVKNFVPLQLSVIAPDGEVVFSPKVSFDGNGEFKRLIHPPLPSYKIGTYTVTVSHPDLDTTARLQFTVAGTTLVKEIETIAPGMGDKIIYPGLEITAEALEGSNTITLSGTSITRDTDVTFSVHSPNGNLVSVEQVTPNSNGHFTVEIKTGGPLWSEDGVYTVTANQGISSELEDSVDVEIVKGKVIPEFGTIAAMILVVSLMSIIVVSTKSKLSIIPRF